MVEMVMVAYSFNAMVKGREGRGMRI